MTEAEREELIEKMAKAAWESEELSDYQADWSQACELGREMYLREQRASLAVAEPVIREQCAEEALKWCVCRPAEVAAAIREGGQDE